MKLLKRTFFYLVIMGLGLACLSISFCLFAYVTVVIFSLIGFMYDRPELSFQGLVMLLISIPVFRLIEKAEPSIDLYLKRTYKKLDDWSKQ